MLQREHDWSCAGRFYDGRVFDLLEVGVSAFRSLRDFGGAAAHVQTGNKVCLPPFKSGHIQKGQLRWLYQIRNEDRCAYLLSILVVFIRDSSDGYIKFEMRTDYVSTVRTPWRISVRVEQTVRLSRFFF